jgi:hypothetical protein
MKYKIQRGINEYGPYTLADLQRYVAQGNILLTDLARSEGMTEWVPVSQVIGDIPVPVPAPAAGETVYSGTSAYGTAGTPAMSAGPIPPDFHWVLVLVFNFLCNWFGVIWLFVEAGFIRKIAPQSKGILLLALFVAGVFGGAIVLAFAGDLDHGGLLPVGGWLGVLLVLGGCVLYFIAVFSMRSDLEDYYNTTENINLRLSGAMTFFFAVYYFQYHFSRIAKWKKTGVLEPQS